MSPESLVEKLYALQDAEYQKFHAKLLPGTGNVIGVRVPLLRAIAKEIIKDPAAAAEIVQTEVDMHEYTMIQSFIVATIKCPDDIKVQMIDKFVPQIYSWAICDCFVNSIKAAKKNPENYIPVIKKYIGSQNEYEERFSAVMLLTHYVIGDYIHMTLELLAEIKGDGYYTKMAVAWAYSVCMVKFPEETFEHLKTANLDEWTIKKTVQKTRESFRCTSELKEKIKELL